MGPTEDRPAPPEGESNVTRSFTPGTVREVSPFSVTLKGDLIFEAKDIERELTITLDLEKAPNSSERMAFYVTQPLDYFTSTNHLVQFLQTLKSNFLETLRATLEHEIVLQLEDVTRFSARTMGVGTDSKTKILDNHIAATRARLEEQLAELPNKPHHSKWAKHTLERAVRIAAMVVYSKGDHLTLQAVRDDLFTLYGEDMPASGEALRKQLEEFNLSWRKIKAETKRMAEFRLKPEAEEGKEFR